MLKGVIQGVVGVEPTIIRLIDVCFLASLDHPGPNHPLPFYDGLTTASLLEIA